MKLNAFQRILDETTGLLEASRHEISSFLAEVILNHENSIKYEHLLQEASSFEKSDISENLVNALKFVRSIYTSTEQSYKRTLMSGL